jgi:glycosyltransferase involved in cell wall biosynthesis
MKLDRISVLQFSNEFVRGGAEEHMMTLLRGLNREYFRICLVCTPELAKLLRPDLPRDVEVIPLSFHKPWQAATAVSLGRILRSRRIQILHSHLFYASLHASPMGWLCRVPVIIETPHVREQWRHGWLNSSYAIDRLVGRCVTGYIAVSEANGRYLAEEKRLPRRKIHVIHNGSDLARFHGWRPASSQLKARLGFAADVPVLLVAGRLEPQKGHSILLQALPKVRAEFPKVRAIFAGEGSLQQELQQQARGLGLGECIRFVGFQSNIEDWFSMADITVLPSFYEGLPLVAIESLAAGTPLVASAVDGTPEIVVHERTGLTVPPGDPGALAQAICLLLANPERRKQYGEAGRRWVLENFTQEEQIRKTQELYFSALGEQASIPQVQDHGGLRNGEVQETQLVGKAR